VKLDAELPSPFESSHASLSLASFASCPSPPDDAHFHTRMHLQDRGAVPETVAACSGNVIILRLMAECRATEALLRFRRATTAPVESSSSVEGSGSDDVVKSNRS
jgi:hypothetical protein